MPKKKQHFVPRVYLNPFVDHAKPKDWPDGKPFEPPVWILEPSLEEPAERRSPGNILRENSLYTLADDDPASPWLEDSLSRLESAYGPVRDALLSREPLTVIQYGTLCLFVGAMVGRGPVQIEHWQRQLDDLADLGRRVAGDQAVAELLPNLAEAGLRTLPARLQAYAEVVVPQGFILVNESRMELVTSDRPVAHVFLHPDDAPIKYFPDSLREIRDRSTEAFFSYMPISPQTAFVCSPLLAAQPGQYVASASLDLAFALNQVTRSRAEKHIVSSTARPYGDLTDATIQMERARREARSPSTGIMIYTPGDRFWIATTAVTHSIDSHPLHGRMEFVAKRPDELRNAAHVTDIVEVRIYEAGRQSGGMRDCWLASVSAATDGKFVIENWPGGWAAWRERHGGDSDGV